MCMCVCMYMYVYVCVRMCTISMYVVCIRACVGVWVCDIRAFIHIHYIDRYTHKHIQRKFSRGHSQKSHKCRTPRWLYRCCIETTKRTPKQIEQVQFTIVLVCRTLLSIAVLGGANGCYKSQSTKNVHIRYAGAKKIGSKMPCSEDFGAPSRDKLTKRHQHPPTSHSLMAISLQILSVLPHISWFYPHSLLSYFSHPFVEKNLMLSSMRKNAPPKKKHGQSVIVHKQKKHCFCWLWSSSTEIAKKTRLNCPSSLIVGLGARSFCTASVRIWYALFPPAQLSR